MAYQIYKLNLKNDKKVKFEKATTVISFSDKDNAIAYCNTTNRIESELDSSWYYFYIKTFESGDPTLDELPIEDEILLEEAKNQIKLKFEALSNEKVLIDKAVNKLLSM